MKPLDTPANRQRRKDGMRPGCKPLCEENEDGEVKSTGFVCYSFYRPTDPNEPCREDPE